MPTAPYNATITSRDDVTEALAVFHIRSDADAHPFTPGQYLTLGLLSDEKLVQRPYSVASSARRTLEGYELYVRLVPGGALTPLLFERREGDRVSIRGPKGRFTLLPGDERVHLFVATGCGIAPFMSMLRTLRDDRARRPIILVHGVSYVRELAYRPFLEELAGEAADGFVYVPTISRAAAPENAEWSGSTGRSEAVVSRVCERYGLAPGSCVAYVCGNPEMTGAAQRILRDRGFDDRQVHTELYWPLATR
ncbi:MAG: FAD-binding oxidoreductase [Chloroflexota bacterium]